MSRSQLRYHQLNQLLVDRFPDVSGEALQLFGSDSTDLPGPHVVYEDILARRVNRILRSKEPHSDSVRLFAFLEELVCFGDPEVLNAVSAAVLEAIYEQKETRAAAWKSMGPKTRTLAAEVGDWSK